jgi:hypothetical protein
LLYGNPIGNISSAAGEVPVAMVVVWQRRMAGKNEKNCSKPFICG